MIKVITYQPYERTSEDVFFLLLFIVAVIATTDDAVAVVIIVRFGLINITLFAYIYIHLWRRARQQYLRSCLYARTHIYTDAGKRAQIHNFCN